MEQSTQWGVSLPNTFLKKKHLKSRNPALNIPRRHEAVATDTVFSDTPAVDSGVKQAHVFVGRDTLVADAYPMKSGKQFVNTLEDNIWRRGAMDKLLSDSSSSSLPSYPSCSNHVVLLHLLFVFLLFVVVGAGVRSSLLSSCIVVLFLCVIVLVLLVAIVVTSMQSSSSSLSLSFIIIIIILAIVLPCCYCSVL